MKIKWKMLLLCIAIPLVSGMLAGAISRGSRSAFEELLKPPLSPPGWVFPVVWTILFILMGIASYLVIVSGAPKLAIRKALTLYGLQLLFNFCWTFWFFNLQLYWFAFIWLAVLWLLILATTVSFWRISKPAAYLMLPYLLWVTFAGYLNFGIARLN